MIRPSGHTIYTGVLAEMVNGRNQKLVTESGVLGGDLLPRAFYDSTVKELENQLDKIAMECEDDVSIRVVGSGRFGVQSKSVFGDLDVILRMEKPETLSRIKEWVFDNAQNVRDIESRKHGDDLAPEDLGTQFSFLFPIYKEGAEHLTIGELRAILQSRHGSTNWKQHHDERLRVQQNLKNLDGKSGLALVQIDVMRCIVDGMEMETLTKQAKKFIEHLKASRVDTASKYTQFLQQFLDDQELDDFEDHYEFLRTHGELQDTEAQQLLTAIYYLREKSDHKDHLGKRFDNVQYRYSFHPDSLQIIYYLANQLGIILDDDSFDRQTLGQIIQAAMSAGVVSDKLSVDLLYNPAEAFATLKGKHKEQAKMFILANTKNKRAEEGNPQALYRNYGTRQVKRL